MNAPTPHRSDLWISAETEHKERDFHAIVGLHLTICRLILSRRPHPPYLYADLHAGPGNLTFEGRDFDGSPLVFLRLAAEVGVRHQSLFFDQDATVAGRLSAAMSWLEVNGSTEVVPEPCETGMTKWLAAAGLQPDRYGLVYADPIGKEIPVDLLARVAEHLPRVDILSYVAATGYKRRGGPRLRDHIAAVPKRYAYVREPAGQWQWTFILWTNFPSDLSWKKRNFYRVDTDHGQRTLDRLDLTRREHHEATNEPLPLFKIPGGSR